MKREYFVRPFLWVCIALLGCHGGPSPGDLPGINLLRFSEGQIIVGYNSGNLGIFNVGNSECILVEEYDSRSTGPKSWQAASEDPKEFFGIGYQGDESATRVIFRDGRFVDILEYSDSGMPEENFLDATALGDSSNVAAIHSEATLGSYSVKILHFEENHPPKLQLHFRGIEVDEIPQLFGIREFLVLLLKEEIRVVPLEERVPMQRIGLENMRPMGGSKEAIFASSGDLFVSAVETGKQYETVPVLYILEKGTNSELRRIDADGHTIGRMASAGDVLVLATEDGKVGIMDQNDDSISYYPFLGNIQAALAARKTGEDKLHVAGSRDGEAIIFEFSRTADGKWKKENDFICARKRFWL